MLSRTESIDGFHLKVSRTERGLYEEFLKTEEAAILAEIQHYFAEAKQQVAESDSSRKLSGQKIENRVDTWITSTCDDKHLKRELVGRAKEAILHRVGNLIAKTIRESFGTR